MITDDANHAAGPSIRETYEEYDVGATRVAMIADPDNAHAWIQSTHTLSIER